MKIMNEDLKKFIETCKVHNHYDFYNTPETDFESVHQKFNWIRDESNLPSLKLSINFPYEKVWEEVKSIEHRFVKHRGEKHPGWESMCIHGVNTEQTDDWRSPIYQDKGYTEKPLHTWTDIADNCPVLKSWLSDVFPGEGGYDRIRFMMLRPGGYIFPHQDYDNRSLNAVNVAINNPEGCEFAMEDAGTIPWMPGDVRAIDIGRKHCVYNGSSEDRIHIIIHGNHNVKFKQLVCDSYDHLLKNLSMA